MKKTPEDKLPQNLKDLLKDIGENSVLFHIYTQIYDTQWQAFKNLVHSGCDLVLLNMETNQVVKIEVKTRQLLYTTAVSRNTVNQRQFTVTKNEYDNMDLLICYWFEHNAYFIIPKADLKPGRSSTKLVIRKDSKDGFGKNSSYLNRWENLLALLE